MSSRIISFRPAAQLWRRLPLQCKRHSNRGCLLNRLHASLDPRQLMGVYWDELRQLLGMEGLRWEHQGLCQQAQLGLQQGWLRVYRLFLGDQDLGELALSRSAPLQERELLLLEQTLDLLIQPLHNAVLYQQALAAALRDPLTGLGNRAAFEQALLQELELACRHGMPLSLALLDIDHFKEINDNHGHLAGDAVLTHVAAAIRGQARQSDLLFRYAGDEFVILMRHTDRLGACTVAERIRRAVERQPFSHAERELPVRLSIGVATADPRESADGLFERADRALLAAKRSGRNRIHWAEPLAAECRVHA